MIVYFIHIKRSHYHGQSPTSEMNGTNLIRSEINDTGIAGSSF